MFNFVLTYQNLLLPILCPGFNFMDEILQTYLKFFSLLCTTIINSSFFHPSNPHSTVWVIIKFCYGTPIFTLSRFKNDRFSGLFRLFFHGFFEVGIKFCHNRGKKMAEIRKQEKRWKYWKSIDCLLKFYCVGYWTNPVISMV